MGKQDGAPAIDRYLVIRQVTPACDALLTTAVGAVPDDRISKPHA